MRRRLFLGALVAALLVFALLGLALDAARGLAGLRRKLLAPPVAPTRGTS